MKSRFVLKSESSELQPFRKQVRELLSKWNWSDKQIGEWALVLDEALTNVMRHAYPGIVGEIVIEAIDSEKQTEFLIEDHGNSFDPTQLPPPDLPKETPGGLGVHLIRSLTDRFEYDSSFKKGNRIRLVRYKVRSSS